MTTHRRYLYPAESLLDAHIDWPVSDWLRRGGEWRRVYLPTPTIGFTREPMLCPPLTTPPKPCYNESNADSRDKERSS